MLLLEPGVADLVDDKARELAAVAARSAREVGGLPWRVRYNYSAPRTYGAAGRQAVITHKSKESTRGTSAKSGVARRRTSIVAFHPDAKGRQAGRMAIRKALRLGSAEAFESDERDKARKKADKQRAATRKRELKAADRARAKRLAASDKAAARAKAKARRSADRQKLAAERKDRAAFLRAQKKAFNRRGSPAARREALQAKNDRARAKFMRDQRKARG